MKRPRLKLMTRGGLLRLGILFTILSISGFWAWNVMTDMPGTIHRGPLPALNPSQVVLRDLLRRHVEKLAGEIGERNTRQPKALKAAAEYIDSTFRSAGLLPRRLEYDASGMPCENIEVEIPGSDRRSEIVVVGGHYDSVMGSQCPGANDNGTGAAATLALASRFAEKRPSRTLRFVAFVNEEPPYFQTAAMGSWVYAKACRARGDRITAMISLETLGYYSDSKGSQSYPYPFSVLYPSTGNFIGFVGNTASRDLLRQAIGSFRRHAELPSEGAALPDSIPGVGWSDHWSFWQEGYPGIMVTDTAPFRYAHYHRSSDTPEKVDYDRMSLATDGLSRVIEELCAGVDSAR